MRQALLWLLPLILSVSGNRSLFASEPAATPISSPGVVSLLATMGSERLTGTATIIDKGVLITSLDFIPSESLFFYPNQPSATITATISGENIPLRLVGVLPKWSLAVLVPIDTRKKLPDPVNFSSARAKPGPPIAPGSVLRYTTVDGDQQTTLTGTFMKDKMPWSLRIQALPKNALGCPLLATDGTCLGILTKGDPIHFCAETAPPNVISEVLAGTVTNFHTATFNDAAPQQRMQVIVVVADPLQRISNLRVEFTPLALDQTPKKSPAISVPLKRLATGLWSTAVVPTTRGLDGFDVRYDIAVSWKNAKGQRRIESDDLANGHVGDHGIFKYNPGPRLDPMPFPLGLPPIPTLKPPPSVLPALGVGADGNAVATVVPMPQAPKKLQGMISAPDGTALYTADPERSLILVLDPVDLSVRHEWPVPKTPTRLGCTSQQLVVCCPGSDQVVVMNPADGRLLASWSTHAIFPQDTPLLVLCPDGPDGWLVLWRSGIWRHQLDGGMLLLDHYTANATVRYPLLLKDDQILWFGSTEFFPMPHPGGVSGLTQNDLVESEINAHKKRVAWIAKFDALLKDRTGSQRPSSGDNFQQCPDGKAILFNFLEDKKRDVTMSFNSDQKLSSVIPGILLAVDATRNEVVTVSKVEVPASGENPHRMIVRLARLPELTVTKTITVQATEREDLFMARNTSDWCYVPGHRILYLFDGNQKDATVRRVAFGP